METYSAEFVNEINGKKINMFQSVVEYLTMIDGPVQDHHIRAIPDFVETNNECEISLFVDEDKIIIYLIFKKHYSNLTVDKTGKVVKEGGVLIATTKHGFVHQVSSPPELWRKRYTDEKIEELVSKFKFHMMQLNIGNVPQFEKIRLLKTTTELQPLVHKELIQRILIE